MENNSVKLVLIILVTLFIGSMVNYFAFHKIIENERKELKEMYKIVNQALESGLSDSMNLTIVTQNLEYIEKNEMNSLARHNCDALLTLFPKVKTYDLKNEGKSKVTSEVLSKAQETYQRMKKKGICA